MEWLIDQGVRQVVSGIVKWRSWQKISAGLIQLIYPIPGFIAGLRYPAALKGYDCEKMEPTLQTEERCKQQLPTIVNPRP